MLGHCALIEPRGVDGKPAAGRTLAKTRVLQVHAVSARPPPRTAMSPAITPATVSSVISAPSARASTVQPSTTSACDTWIPHCEPVAVRVPVPRSVRFPPHLYAAQRDVRIGRMQLRHGVLPSKRQYQVAVGAEGLACVVVELQVGFDNW